MKASQVLSQEIRLDRLLKRLMTIVIENAGAQKGILLLKKDQQWRIEAEQNDGDSEATVLESIPLALLGDDEIKLPLSLVHLVSRTRESVVIQDAISQPLFEADPYVQRHQVHSALCIPVMNHNEMTGMLYLENNAIAGAFTPTHLEMLNVLASQVAISIENARLYAEMEERVAARTAELKALTLQDGLTGIANRRAFEERLQLELGRTQRSGQPLAVLMIDIDHFKLVNDRYGHPVGDHCLTLMGRTLSHCCQRTGDFVARYGGEEFVCILADTDLQGATVFAERVLTAVRTIVLEVGADRHPITSSVGIAITAPYAPMAASDLIACADRRLYGAKLAGRDCIVNHD
jgi:diguanylate cyclase (GGDEF)-like protein